jgi:hypothetical protein
MPVSVWLVSNPLHTTDVIALGSHFAANVAHPHAERMLKGSATSSASGGRNVTRGSPGVSRRPARWRTRISTWILPAVTFAPSTLTLIGWSMVSWIPGRKSTFAPSL